MGGQTHRDLAKAGHRHPLGVNPRLLWLAAALTMLAAVTTFDACSVRQRRPDTGALRSATGLATYYGREFHGRSTASGRRFDMHAAVAAHPNYPFGTKVRVTNLANQRAVVVTIVDRGPVKAQQSAGIIIDVSQGAAATLAFVRDGRARVRVDVLQWGRQ